MLLEHNNRIIYIIHIITEKLINIFMNNFCGANQNGYRDNKPHSYNGK